MERWELTARVCRPIKSDFHNLIAESLQPTGRGVPINQPNPLQTAADGITRGIVHTAEDVIEFLAEAPGLSHYCASRAIREQNGGSQMIVYSLEPCLVPIHGGYVRMLDCVRRAMAANDWEQCKTDQHTQLCAGTKADARFHCCFYWSDAEGNETERQRATHLAVIVRSARAAEKECLREQQLLASEIKSVRFQLSNGAP